MPLESLAIAAPVIFLAYAVFGMTGFGAAMVAVPLLVQFLPLQFAVPLVVLFDLVCTALVGGRNWRQVSRGELKRLFPWMLLGIALGVTLLHNAGAKWPLMLLGTFVLAVCIKGLRRAPATTTAPLSGHWAFPFGVFGGIFSALFGTAGLYSQPQILSVAAALLPVSLLGLFAGSRLRTRVPAEMLKRSIFVLLAIAGAGAIYRGWLSPS